MRGNRQKPTAPEPMKLCTFFIGDRPFGVDILKVLEINKNRTITPVPRAPESVVGVMNLRGRIVTVIDLAGKLGLSGNDLGRDTGDESAEDSGARGRTIIVRSREEHIGLRVDRVGDVVPVRPADVAPPPVHIDGVLGKFTEGVLRQDGILIGILDIEAVLA
jgi:purine-binding chemotaxis protein CheW